MADSPPHRLFLLDGMALVYRAHFAFFKPIVTSKGMNVSAVYGFANTLFELIKTQKPTHLAVVFDTSAPTARHIEFPAYKAQREAMPEELSAAIPYVKRLAEALNIPVLTMDGFEADDIIGTLARRAEAHGDFVTFMVTPDKDFAQLVDERTFMYKPGRQGAEHEIIDTGKVCEQWLVERPEQVIDVLALWGDASDNIPGVPGIGEKTAKTLIQKFGTVETLLTRLHELKGKQKENLEANAEQLKLCKRLATIDIKVPLTTTLHALEIQPMNDEAVKELLMEMEFNQLGRRLFGDGFRAGRGFVSEKSTIDPAAAESVEMPPQRTADLKALAETPHEYRQINASELADLNLKSISLAWDLDGTDPKSTRIRGVALSWEAHKACYLSCPGALPQELLDLLGNPSLIRIGYDIKPKLTTMLWNNIPASGYWHDLFLAQLLADPDQKSTFNYLTESLLGYTPLQVTGGTSNEDFLALETTDESQQRMDRVMEEADLCWQLYPLQMAQIESSGQTRVFHEIEMPLLPILATMERQGIKVDLEALRELGLKLQQQITVLETSIQELAGQNFNLNSPRQLGQILFEKLQLVAKPKKTKTGQYVTNEEVLQDLVSLHPIVAKLLEYREATKLKSTYVDALPHSVSPRTGRVHTNYLQLSTATGRLASNHPNLQNIPIRSEQGREIRRAFVAPSDDWLLISADYSQIELRVMAELSEDETMRDAFRNGEDIHSATAAKVFGVMPSLVTSDMRRTAKTVNFGIIYGISAFGLSQRLGISRSESQKLIDEYFVQYPKIKKFMDVTIENAAKCGYVETLTGRRRILRDIRSANATVRKAAERTAINTPIQGTAADMIKLAMIKVQQLITEGRLQAKMLLQVHDELVFEAPESEVAQLKELVTRAMQSALPLSIPIQVDFGTGKNWKAAHS